MVATKNKAANGTRFTDEDIEKWAAEAKSAQGYTGGHLGSSASGRPISVGTEAKPVTFRLGANRCSKLDWLARERHTTPSDLIRGLIDSL